MDECKLCGKLRVIYKLGCCKSCYTYHLIKKYKLKDDVNFHINSQKEMIEEFLANPTIKTKKELADKYCMTIRNIDYAINMYCDKYYVRRDNENIIIK